MSSEGYIETVTALFDILVREYPENDLHHTMEIAANLAEQVYSRYKKQEEE